MSHNTPKIFVRGDLDGFIGLFIDNLLQLMLISILCPLLCGLPPELIITRILPGAAFSIFVGNVFYSWQAYRLAKKTGRNDITALPYGINTVSLIAFISLVMAPVYQQTKDVELTWMIGLFACLVSGLLETIGAFCGDYIRRHTPRAALLSALAGIAITFIAMGFVFQIFASPIVALVPALLIILFYASNMKLPLNLPGGLVAVFVGTALAWILKSLGHFEFREPPAANVALGLYLPSIFIHKLVPFILLEEGWKYLSVIIPMALFSVIGSLQNLESAEAAGDSFHTRSSLLMNGFGTLSAAFMGSPFPTTIYIGHPGWKTMGARIGYSALNAIIISILCLLGAVTVVLKVVPMEATLGILLWIGIIMMAQSFHETPKHHALAVSLGLIPAFAGWALLLIEGTLRVTGTSLDDALNNFIIQDIHIEGMIALNQGFLITSMILASLTVCLIEHRFRAAFLWCCIGAVLSMLGIIHAYTINQGIIQISLGFYEAPQFIIAYLITGCLIFALGKIASRKDAN
ncbi:MAG: NCS2 family permease [Verrucomicrobiota bacterium]